MHAPVTAGYTPIQAIVARALVEFLRDREHGDRRATAFRELTRARGDGTALFETKMVAAFDTVEDALFIEVGAPGDITDDTVIAIKKFMRMRERGESRAAALERALRIGEVLADTTIEAEVFVGYFTDLVIRLDEAILAIG